MNRRITLMLAGMALLSFALLPSGALSQQRSLKDQLVGTWTVVSAEQTLPNGTKLQPFGANPKGVLTFDANGRLYFFIARSDLPKMASNSRLNPTPYEAKAIAEGTFAQVSTYSVDEEQQTFTAHTDASTFANIVGTDGNFSILLLTADELKYSFEPLGVGKIENTFRRAR